MEVIETKEFFGFQPDQIEVLVHRESLIHALVGYVDGGLIDSAVDVRISGSVSPAIVAPGASVVFAFTPGNDSNVPLPDGVRIVVTLPPGFTPGRITAPGYTTRVEGNTIVLVYTGVLLPGEQPPPFDIEAQVSSGPGTFTVEATIRARGFDLDPTPGNNLESLQVTVVRASIPQTGSEISRWLGTGSVLAASGLALVLLSRRRRRRSALETT